MNIRFLAHVRAFVYIAVFFTINAYFRDTNQYVKIYIHLVYKKKTIVCTQCKTENINTSIKDITLKVYTPETFYRVL